jgi:hypothetical protein
MPELHLHSPVRLHGVALNQLRIGKILPFASSRRKYKTFCRQQLEEMVGVADLTSLLSFVNLM